MTVESATLISDLNVLYPLDSDDAGEGAAHIRLIKTLLKNNYANGSWTPTVGYAVDGNFSPTYVTQVGNYKRIEDFCMFSMLLRWTPNAYTTASGALQIRGLPFAAASSPSSQSISAARLDFILFVSTARTIAMQIDAGNTFMTMYQNLNASVAQQVVTTDTPAGQTYRVEMTGVYRTVS